MSQEQTQKTGHTPGPYKRMMGIIFTEGDPYGHGPMRIADLRGWGHLTGIGACNFDEEKASDIQDATGDFIARACNNHESLLEALKQLRINANRLCDRNLGGTYEDDCRRSLAVAESAIQKAEDAR